jgi:hypothetical protein
VKSEGSSYRAREASLLQPRQMGRLFSARSLWVGHGHHIDSQHNEPLDFAAGQDPRRRPGSGIGSSIRSRFLVNVATNDPIIVQPRPRLHALVRVGTGLYHDDALSTIAGAWRIGNDLAIMVADQVKSKQEHRFLTE